MHSLTPEIKYPFPPRVFVSGIPAGARSMTWLHSHKVMHFTFQFFLTQIHTRPKMQISYTCIVTINKNVASLKA